MSPQLPSNAKEVHTRPSTTMKRSILLVGIYLSHATSLSSNLAPRVSSRQTTSPSAAVLSAAGSSTMAETTSGNELLDKLQEKAAPIASSFEPGTFDPWLTNCHIQTIGGFFVRDICPYVPQGNTAAAVTFGRALWNRFTASEERTNDDFWDHRERVKTPDGDWFHADSKYVKDDSSTAPTVILLHGLESNSKSSLSTEMARSYLNAGMNCVCINFRGCSGENNDLLGGYHLGFTDDLKHYLEIQKQRSPDTRVYLSGFSLGANVVLKCLGDLGEAAGSEYNIHGAAVSCAPLDQMQNAAVLALPGINRVVYTNNLLESLKGRAVQQLEQFFDNDEATTAFDYAGAMRAKTITDFDDAFIAPIYGFDSAQDYYRKTSSVFVLDRISVPTMILNARDDPFLSPNVWPTEKSREHGGPAPLKMIRTEHGGHLGFCWHRVADKDGITPAAAGSLQQPPPSWASTEQARFLAHVHTHPDTENLA